MYRCFSASIGTCTCMQSDTCTVRVLVCVCVTCAKTTRDLWKAVAGFMIVFELAKSDDLLIPNGKKT
jgi:hypothetical protein